MPVPIWWRVPWTFSRSSSSTYSPSYAPGKAVDGLTTSLFSSNAGPSQWWESSLPASGVLTQLQIVNRSDGYDSPAERENFQIQVSNSQVMSPGTFTVACSVGSTPLAYASTFTCTLPPGPWQYVAVVKTDSTELTFSEVRIFGQ